MRSRTASLRFNYEQLTMLENFLEWGYFEDEERDENRKYNEFAVSLSAKIRNCKRRIVYYESLESEEN